MDFMKSTHLQSLTNKNNFAKCEEKFKSLIKNIKQKW